MHTQPKAHWCAVPAQTLANRSGQPTYIVTRTDVMGPYTAILFQHELKDADLPNVLWGFRTQST